MNYIELFKSLIRMPPAEEKRKFIFLFDDVERSTRLNLIGYNSFCVSSDEFSVGDLERAISDITSDYSTTWNVRDYSIVAMCGKIAESRLVETCRNTDFRVIPSKRLYRHLKIKNEIPQYLFDDSHETELNDKLMDFINSECGAAEPPAKKRKFPKLKRANEIKNADIQELRVFVGVGEEVPLLVEGTCLLSAKPKLGKSWLCSQLCKCITEGKSFLGYEVNRCHAVYLDLETVEQLEKKRLNKLSEDDLDEGYYIVDSILDTETNELLTIGHGFEEFIEECMTDDPEIGLFIVDVFQKIRNPKKGNESEYDFVYREIGPLNDIAKKYHISIILVCHDRKTIDSSDPFTNILGSTALPGATDQMIILYKDKFNDEFTHIAAKGRTLDGIVEINAKIQNGGWVRSDLSNAEVSRKKNEEEAYLNNPFRVAMIKFLEEEPEFKGRCSTFVNRCLEMGIQIEDNLKGLGGFFIKYKDLAEKLDGVTISSTRNGSGGKTYSLVKHSTVDTVGIVDGKWLNVDENSEIPFI